MSRKSVSDLLKDAVAYKEQGNALFKAGEYRKAVTKYATVFAFTRGLPGSKRSKSSLPVDIGKTGGTPLDPALENEASELERLCEQNIATCYIKLNSGAEALEHANKALSLNPSAAKSLLRKGQALMLLSNYEDARTTLKNAIKNSSEEAVTRSCTEELVKADKLYKERSQRDRERERRAFAGVFEKAAKEEKGKGLSDSYSKRPPVPPTPDHDDDHEQGSLTPQVPSSSSSSNPRAGKIFN